MKKEKKRKEKKTLQIKKYFIFFKKKKKFDLKKCLFFNEESHFLIKWNFKLIVIKYKPKKKCLKLLISFKSNQNTLRKKS